MKPIAKLGYLGAACALVITTFAILEPRAVGAAVATLVQVANTVATPAINQDVSKLASQNVELSCAPTCNQVFPDATRSFNAFTVPAGQHLVISTVQLEASSGGSTTLSQQSGIIVTSRTTWLLFAAGTYQFQYPSGIVFAPGTTNITIPPTGGVNNVYMYGYLTWN
jgi:hypothetical protein